ncbi:hypothetical protein BC937DRAFT_86603 [Endogone sp. FLAS-F59071]|nr:hypothetical protein BC937DRAFT_86603 [Endogone sp. FLAS-F59071]|eukprot:RUS19980.1 hypothetical protein BC937DRAFT_86603 [Endogone sp. FLAS-F59071]
MSSEASANIKPTTTMPASPATTPPATPQHRARKYKLVDDILTEPCLYRVLGLERTCTTEEIRRAYIGFLSIYAKYVVILAIL